MSASLAQQLAWLFPSAVPTVDYLVQDDTDGKGPYIKIWNLSAPQPSAAQLAAAQPPYVPAAMTFRQFMSLFTQAEQAAIINSSDTETKLFVAMAAGAGGSLALTNPEVIAGITYVATPPTAAPPGPGLITAARAQQILAGQAPPSS